MQQFVHHACIILCSQSITANQNMLGGSSLKLIVLVTISDMTRLTCLSYTQGQLFLLAMHTWGS